MVLLIFTHHAYAYEEAEYEVIERISKNIEIRSYPYLTLATSKIYNKSANNNFRNLFNFISGDNSEKLKINMTIPVLRIEEQNMQIMSFVLPQKFNKEKLPQPNNKNIKIEELINNKFIVLRFSGRANLRNFTKYQKILENFIVTKEINAEIDKPIKAYYNTPWTLPFLKRNEILFRLK